MLSNRNGIDEEIIKSLKRIRDDDYSDDVIEESGDISMN